MAVVSKQVNGRLAMPLLALVVALSVFAWGSQLVGAAGLPRVEIDRDVILENGYRVTFDGVDYHEDGTSTWFYTLEELPGAQDLSNWVLEIPFCAPIINAGPEPWEMVDPDPNARLSGVKWETGAGFRRGEFWVTLATAGQVGMTTVAAKGPDLAYGDIAGPTCIPADPPVEPGDGLPPTITWVAPVQEGARYDVTEGHTVLLVVTATDDVAVDRVVFARWDPVTETLVTIAVDREPPYEAVVSDDTLNPTWNRILAASFDVEGNQSEWEGIWLYRATEGALFPPPETMRVYLPLIR